jgi:hypothetical protein
VTPDKRKTFLQDEMVLLETLERVCPHQASPLHPVLPKSLWERWGVERVRERERGEGESERKGG